jgi:hypothetical protein
MATGPFGCRILLRVRRVERHPGELIWKKIAMADRNSFENRHGPRDLWRDQTMSVNVLLGCWCVVPPATRPLSIRHQ